MRQASLPRFKHQNEGEMIKTILPQKQDARAPVQRNTLYEPFKVRAAALTATEAEPPSGKSKVLEDNLATA